MTSYLGDCLEIMPTLPAASVDLILCDLPYGTTQNKWDSVLPLDQLWAQYWRIAKPNAAIVLFGTEPFSSSLRISNLSTFRYDWVWNKSTVTGFLNSKKRPLKTFELVSVFYREACTYNPQMWESIPMNSVYKNAVSKTNNYGTYDSTVTPADKLNRTERFPVDIINISQMPNNHGDRTGHPTQKPVALMEYLIRTYTNEGDTVLDNCMGSGTTGVACKNTGRNFIGIERDPTYFEIARKRISPYPWETA
jgi:site-specific DNA-methyltransferase (adenine-specific)